MNKHDIRNIFYLLNSKNSKSERLTLTCDCWHWNPADQHTVEEVSYIIRWAWGQGHSPTYSATIKQMQVRENKSQQIIAGCRHTMCLCTSVFIYLLQDSCTRIYYTRRLLHFKTKHTCWIANRSNCYKTLFVY